MRNLTPGWLRPVAWPSGRGVLGRYAAAWAYLAAFVLAELIDSALPGRNQSLLLHWASTNVVNLHHHPLGALVVSALIAPAFAWAWPALIALALFGANRVLGNGGTAAARAAGSSTRPGSLTGNSATAWVNAASDARAGMPRHPGRQSRPRSSDTRNGRSSPRAYPLLMAGSSAMT